MANVIMAESGPVRSTLVRVYLDTRFRLRQGFVGQVELDIDMDADGDSTSLEYINGGITSTAAAPISHPHQLAEWGA